MRSRTLELHARRKTAREGNEEERSEVSVVVLYPLEPLPTGERWHFNSPLAEEE